MKNFKNYRLLKLLAWCLLLPASTLFARQSSAPKPNIGWVPREILERPVTLKQGIGAVHQSVTTSSPEAQAFYDQGLAYLNSYVWIEAARSFNQALRIDPSLAMAYLGLSDAYIGLQDVAEAASAFEKGQALAEKVSPRERSWINIRALYFNYLADSSDMQKYFSYRQGITDALATNPDDPFLWILRGFADEGTPIAHGQNGGIDTIAFYRAALSVAPTNFAAHHYLAHTMENIGPSQEAVDQAGAYMRLAPAIPHAHHMYGHELRRAGRTEEAIAEFLKADELENTYYRTENIPAKYDWHHAHNLTLLALSYETIGQMKLAEATFKKAFELPQYSDLAEYNRKSWPEFLLSRNRPKEALDASQNLIQSQWTLPQFAGHALAGRALLALGRIPDAEKEFNLAEEKIQQVPKGAAERFPDVAQLQAELLLHNKKWDQGNALMDHVAQQLVALPGPDSWSATVFQLENIFNLARKLDDWELAESIAEKLITHDPSYAGSHYAAAFVAEHKGDTAAAQEQFSQGEKLWAKADSDAKPKLALQAQR